jgi:hypothetical protein
MILLIKRNLRKIIAYIFGVSLIGFLIGGLVYLIAPSSDIKDSTPLDFMVKGAWVILLIATAIIVIVFSLAQLDSDSQQSKFLDTMLNDIKKSKELRQVRRLSKLRERKISKDEAEHKAFLSVKYQNVISKAEAEGHSSGYQVLIMTHALSKLTNGIEPKKVENWVVETEKQFTKFL